MPARAQVRRKFENCHDEEQACIQCMYARWPAVTARGAGNVSGTVECTCAGQRVRHVFDRVLGAAASGAPRSSPWHGALRYQRLDLLRALVLPLTRHRLQLPRCYRLPVHGLVAVVPRTARTRAAVIKMLPSQIEPRVCRRTPATSGAASARHRRQSHYKYTSLDKRGTMVQLALTLALTAARPPAAGHWQLHTAMVDCVATNCGWILPRAHCAGYPGTMTASG